jgi:hypothetical protein
MRARYQAEHALAPAHKALRSRVEYVDRPSDIEGFAQPARDRPACVHAQPLRLMPHLQLVYRIPWDHRSRRHVGQGPAVWPPEAEDAVGPAFDRIPLLMDGAMMPAA